VQLLGSRGGASGGGGQGRFQKNPEGSSEAAPGGGYQEQGPAVFEDDIPF
jgi:hypothetical protein